VDVKNLEKANNGAACNTLRVAVNVVHRGIAFQFWQLRRFWQFWQSPLTGSSIRATVAGLFLFPGFRYVKLGKELFKAAGFTQL
jgi:hypothetical protein